jgi:hypothetical protein
LIHPLLLPPALAAAAVARVSMAVFSTARAATAAAAAATVPSLAGIKGYVQHLPRTTAGDFVKRQLAAACASSGVPLRQLHLRTGLSREVLTGERAYQTQAVSSLCSLPKPQRQQRCDRRPAEMELLCWQLLHSPACCKPDNLRRTKVLVTVPGGDPDDPQIEAHNYCELDGDGSLDHLYHNCIKNTTEWARILELQKIHNQMLKVKNPKRTTTADLSVGDNWRPFLRRCMCKCVGVWVESVGPFCGL